MFKHKYALYKMRLTEKFNFRFRIFYWEILIQIKIIIPVRYNN